MFVQRQREILMVQTQVGQAMNQRMRFMEDIIQEITATESTS